MEPGPGRLQYGRLNREARLEGGIDLPKQQYNRWFRALGRLSAKAARLGDGQELRRLVLVGRSGFATDIPGTGSRPRPSWPRCRRPCRWPACQGRTASVSSPPTCRADASGGHSGGVFGMATDSYTSPDGARQLSMGVNRTKYQSLDENGNFVISPIDYATVDYLLLGLCGQSPARTKAAQPEIVPFAVDRLVSVKR